ncbi:MAG: transcription-repair-coupling factor [Candidatus Hydrogenedentota bacterium]
MNLPLLKYSNAIAEKLVDAKAPLVELVGPWGSAKSLYAVQVATATERPLLVVAPGRIEAEGIYEDLIAFEDPARCALLPAWEVMPADIMDPTDDIVAERMSALMQLADALAAGVPMRLVAPVRSIMQRVVKRDRLAEQTVRLRVGEETDLDALIRTLGLLGYERELMVEQRGQMSVRGGIFDIFPISSELPYRIEFFGDEIESIRRFEPETQRSVDHIREIVILPRSEKTELQRSAGDQSLAFITDYLPENAIIALDEPAAISEEAHKLAGQLGDNPYIATWESVEREFESRARIAMAQVAHEAAAKAMRVTAPFTSVTGWHGQAEGFWGQLKTWDSEGYTVAVYCANSGERRRLIELAEEKGYRIGEDRFDLRIEIGRPRAAFASAVDKLAVVSEREIFGRHHMRRQRRRFEAGAAITAFSDLKSGDYIVHSQHGIGRYLGIRRFEGKAGDFLALQYMGGDKLYVPVTHIDMVQKYTGGDGTLPKVDRLGGATWAKTKARVKKALRDMTEELVKLYAAREAMEGHAFTPDTPWQLEFEDSFEYDETPDQARAIDDVKRDMESAKPMDRLICGDVGFGKTEVAMRAAFKAVMDGYQAAVLAPTTVLAEQHYNTFCERMADYPVRIEMLSRFRSPKQQAETVEKLKSGDVDIVIGTHRIISKDVQYNKLGLLIIDEEQKFGVAQKEKVKKFRTMVDVLTMSATPIPRTLNMAFMGIRDMSLINTAPNDRLPVHTCIEVFNEQLIQEAINRELARNGQVFFLHNRVQTIHAMADATHRLVPHARIAVGHGQMNEKDLERVMTGFIHREYDVLVCTTIIGSGIDIPNANTILINNADRFGLSELYQLRGRVGRYKHRAFAYLLVAGDKALTEDAQKRLKALEEFSSLGAGFRLAMRDLEIRGCGNLLGGEQHGNISSVGYETYAQLVAEAVSELRGQPIVRRFLPPCEIAIDAYIPEEYVHSETQRITLYKRITGVLNLEEVDELNEELADRFGQPPRPVQRLLDVMRVRALGADVSVSRVVIAKTAVVLEFDSPDRLSRRNRETLQSAFGSRLEFAWNEKPSLTLKLDPGMDEDPLKVAQGLCKTLGEL